MFEDVFDKSLFELQQHTLLLKMIFALLVMCWINLSTITVIQLYRVLKEKKR